jgi:hypothetical protein
LAGEIQRGGATTSRDFVQAAHARLVSLVRPVYSVREWQPASQTLRSGKGSCSQRMACLEAIARAGGVPTRVRALNLAGSFWYPRFRFTRVFIPKKVLLVWPQFFLENTWVDFDELYGPIQLRSIAQRSRFTNDGESLFEAVQHSSVDFLGKTCGSGCAHLDLSEFVLTDDGFFDVRDDAFRQLGFLQHSLRGRLFELIFGGRKSS